MIRTLYLLLIFLFSSNSLLFSKQKVNHFFIEMESPTAKLRFGYVEKMGKRYVQKYFLNEDGSDISWRAFGKHFTKKYKKTRRKRNDILFYTHGFRAHKDAYQDITNYNMHKGLYECKDNSYKTIISLVWHSNLNYKAMRGKTIEMGERFAGIINVLLDVSKEKKSKRKVSFLNHSMGNRIFEGIFTELQSLRKNNKPYIENVIFAAPDIEASTFYKDGTLEHIDRFCNHAIVYRHKRDLTLSMSKLINLKDRLGLDGIDDFTKIPTNVYLIDVSSAKKTEDNHDKISRHGYYTSSPVVRQDIFNILNPKKAKPYPIRTILDHPKNLSIQDVEEKDNEKKIRI